MTKTHRHIYIYINHDNIIYNIQYEMTFLFDFSLLMGTISTKSVAFDVPNLGFDSQGFYDLCCPDPCEGVIHILSFVLANTLAGPKSVQKWCNIGKMGPGI